MSSTFRFRQDKQHLHYFVTTAIVFIWASAAHGAVRDDTGWLNACKCGVSGSNFQTTASTTAGSNRIVVKDIGDLKVGQGITVSRCNIRYTEPAVWGSGPANFNRKPSANSLEVSGYDGSNAGWQVYLLDVASSSTPSFRWSNDMGRTWQPGARINYDWQPLEHNMRVRFQKRDWQSGYTVAFSVRDQLETQIEKIEGNLLILKDAAKQTVKNAVVRHNDTVALQAAIDRAIKQKRNVYIPAGHYNLSRGIRIKLSGQIAIEGQNSTDTVLDISDGEGACFALAGGKEATISNLRLIGFMGFDERDKAGIIRTKGAPGGLWGFAVKYCNAVSISGTERVLIENCHASRMSGECFVSESPSRLTATTDRPYSKSTTYLRCSVTNSARNAFNDTQCGSENTSVINCRIVDVGGCSWEGASRFVKFVGNYVRNAGTVAIGNLGPGNRDKSFDTLGAGQHIVADNTFEEIVPYGGCAIRSSIGSTQVVVRNNLFINFASSAIEALGTTSSTLFPSANILITGNIMDMTCVGKKPVARTAIKATHDDVIIGDNQIYVRGHCDPTVTAISICEPAVNVDVHDNLIRNCGQGIRTGRATGTIAKVIDSKTFTRTEGWGAGLPLDRRNPERCRGWCIVWKSGDKPSDISRIESFDPKTLQFKLQAPHKIKAGDSFEVYPPSANWMIHSNTITGCLHPITLDSHGSHTSLIKDNLISRDNCSGVKQAIKVSGLFYFVGNYISGFDEKNSTAISFTIDPLDLPAQCIFRNNIFNQCSQIVHKTQSGLWDRSNSKGNITINTSAGNIPAR